MRDVKKNTFLRCPLKPRAASRPRRAAVAPCGRRHRTRTQCNTTPASAPASCSPRSRAACSSQRSVPVRPRPGNRRELICRAPGAHPRSGNQCNSDGERGTLLNVQHYRRPSHRPHLSKP